MLHCRTPDGYLIDNLIIWEDLDVNGVAAQGFRISTLDVRAAADSVQDELRDRLLGLYRNLPPEFRLQHRYRPTCPFPSILDDYDRVTATSPFPAVRARRHAHSRRFRRLQSSQQLRAEEVHVFFATRLTNFVGWKVTREGKAGHLRRALTQLRGTFARCGDQLRSALGELATVTPLGDAEHFRLLERTLDPAVADAPGASGREFNPARSIGEQLFSSGIAGHPPHGIHCNGHYQAILTLKAAPNRSESGLFHALTTLPFNTYEVVVNVQPIDVDRLIRKKEDAIATRTKENILAARTGQASVAKDESNRLEEEQIRRLYRGNQKMFAATYAVRVWAKTEAELTSLVTLARRALDGMSGAQSYLATLATTTRKLYFGMWPGWTFGYNKRALDMVDIDLTDILPITGTFQGRPEAPEILLDGACRQTLGDAPRALVAVPSFLGTPPTAQHTLFAGSTGAGKSTTLLDMAYQSSPYYAYECFVEEGYDYAGYAEAHGCKSICVQVDGTHTINYLETGGLPLSATHLSFAAALALHMTGTAKASEAVARRKAILTQYLRILYGTAAADWLRRHRDEAHALMREAYAVREWHRLHLTNDDSLTDAWAAIRDGLASHDDRVCSFVARLPEADIFRFAHDSGTRPLYENHAFTRFRSDEYPQHAALTELILTHRLPEFRSEELDDIATMLRNWTAFEGNYGPLFDGVTTLSLDQRVVHFELGNIPEEQRELKTAVSLLMTGKVRQRIVGMPRELRKRIVIEEMMRFLDVPDADKLIVEFCAQMRKYGCVVWMVVQQLQKLVDAAIAPYVFGNCRQYVILKQLDAGDVTVLANRLPGRFPEPLQQEILGFQTPENLPEHDRYSSLAYYNPNLVPALAGSARLYLPKTVESPL
jgi:hypothetical protein